MKFTMIGCWFENSDGTKTPIPDIDIDDDDDVELSTERDSP